jgi:hypothetical protein
MDDWIERNSDAIDESELATLKRYKYGRMGLMFGLFGMQLVAIRRQMKKKAMQELMAGGIFARTIRTGSLLLPVIGVYLADMPLKKWHFEFKQ